MTAFIDPAGEIVTEIPMNQQGIIYARFQPRQSTTLYVRFGDWFAWIACAIVAVAVLRHERRNDHENP